MEKFELNQTPVRTAKNYGINSIFVEKNEKFAQKIKNLSKNRAKFENINIENAENCEIVDNANFEIDNYLSEDFCKELNETATLNRSFIFKKSSQKPTFITFNPDKKNDVLIDKLHFVIQNDVDAKIVLRFNSNNTSVYQNGILKIDLQDNSSANIIVLNDGNFDAEHYFSIQSSVQKNATLTMNIVDFASKNSIWSYNSKLLGENSTSDVNTLYVGGDKSTIDLNYFVEIFAPLSKTNIEAVGALSGDAQKHFKGTIDFKKGCKKSVGKEDEFCLLLSKNAKSKALPMILCHEEDVDGKHSGAVGKVDEKQMFYCLSRELNYSQALKILVKARFNNVLNKLFDDKLKVEILDKIDGKIE